MFIGVKCKSRGKIIEVIAGPHFCLCMIYDDLVFPSNDKHGNARHSHISVC